MHQTVVTANSPVLPNTFRVEITNTAKHNSINSGSKQKVHFGGVFLFFSIQRLSLRCMGIFHEDPGRWGQVCLLIQVLQEMQNYGMLRYTIFLVSLKKGQLIKIPTESLLTESLSISTEIKHFILDSFNPIIDGSHVLEWNYLLSCELPELVGFVEGIERVSSISWYHFALHLQTINSMLVKRKYYCNF